MKQTVLVLATFFFIAPILVPMGAASHIQDGDECVWNTQASTSTLQMNGISGSSASDVWAAGRDSAAPADGDIVHYDGTTWSHFQDVSRDFLKVDSIASNNVWASQVETSALVGPYHYTGTTFAPTTTNFAAAGAWRGVYSDSPTDGWTVTSAPTGALDLDRILRWNGATWATFTAAPNVAALNAIHGSSGSNIWTVGGVIQDHPEALLWDGASWVEHTTGLPAGVRLNSVWVESSTRAWAVGQQNAADPMLQDELYRWDASGSAWTVLDSGLGIVFNRIWGLSGDNIWITTPTGKVIHYSGGSDFRVQDTGVSTSLLGIWAYDSSHVWAAGDSGIIKQEACHSCIGTYGAFTMGVAPSLFKVLFLFVFSFAIVVGSILKFRKTLVALIVAGGILSPSVFSESVSAAHHCQLTTGSFVADTVGLPAFALMFLFLIVGVVFYVTRRTGGY